MKKLSVILLSFLAPLGAGSDSCLIAGICQTTQSPTRQQMPQIDFEQQICDLGQLSRSKGKKQKCRFTFTNTGEAPLVVEQVETTCGCTSATYTRKPVAPGHQGHVTITFDPSSQSPGLFRKGITVYANTPGGFTRLFIKGEVIDNEEQ